MLGEKDWNGLKSALEQMFADYHKFLELSKRQKRALIEHKVDDLREILLDMEVVADSIFLMDARRRMHMEILAEMQQKEILQISELLKLYPDVNATTYLSIVADLRSIRKDIERITHVNAALINSSRQIIQTTVEAIVHAPSEKAQISSTKTYGSDGAMRKARSIVPRNLFNQKG